MEVSKDDELPIYFDSQILDAAKNFYKGALRCLERKGSDKSSCLYAALHCAVIACELYLKSMSASSVYIDENSDRTYTPKTGEFYKVRSQATQEPMRGSEKSPDIKKSTWITSHDDLMRYVPDELKFLLEKKLTHDEIKWLDNLKRPLLSTRYPFEPDSDHQAEYPRAIEIARKLDDFCRAHSPVREQDSYA